jgi:membrane protein implicated in regulation of membrane protease activity
MSLFLFLILVALVLGIIGFAAHGLFYLLIIGCLVLVADLAYAGVRFRRGSRKQRVAR